MVSLMGHPGISSTASGVRDGDAAAFTPGPWSAYVQSFPHEVLVCTLGPCANYDSPVVEQICWTAKNSWQVGSERHEQ